jgi:hypothetical protein
MAVVVGLAMSRSERLNVFQGDWQSVHPSLRVNETETDLFFPKSALEQNICQRNVNPVLRCNPPRLRPSPCSVTQSHPAQGAMQLLVRLLYHF